MNLIGGHAEIDWDGETTGPLVDVTGRNVLLTPPPPPPGWNPPEGWDIYRGWVE